MKDTKDYLDVCVSGVPSFSISYGPNIDYWHKERDESPNQEPWETQVFIKMLSDQPRILDIGANVGWYSCVASALSMGKAEIHAFEPEPGNFALLQGNLEINGFSSAHAHQMALSNINGEGSLFLNEDNPGDHRISDISGRQSIDITLRTLDSFLDTKFCPDLVKIDVQGAEPLVFDGAKGTFKRAGESLAMLVEFQPESMGIEVSHDFVDTLFSFGLPLFDLYPYDGGALRPIGREVLHEAVEGCLHPKFETHINILMAPNDDRFARIESLIGAPFTQWSH